MKFGNGIVRDWLYSAICIVLCMSVFAASPAQAQRTPAVSAQTDIDPDFAGVTPSAINAEISAVEGNTALAEDDRKRVLESYNKALQRLTDRDTEKAKADLLIRQRENAPTTIAEIEAEIDDIRAVPMPDTEALLEQYTDLPLSALEQMLAAQTTKVSALRSEADKLEANRQTLERVPTAIRTLLAETRRSIDEVTQQLEQQNQNAATPSERAAQTLARANFLALRERERALEQEATSNRALRDILAKRAILVSEKLIREEAVLTVLQRATEIARSMNVDMQASEAMQDLEDAAAFHPLVRAYAQENVNITQQAAKIVSSEENLPASETRIRAQLEQVENDTNVTNQILDNDSINRNYGAHLRQLRQKQPLISNISSQIKRRSKELEEALFQKIVNQEALQQFNAAPLNVDIALAAFRQTQTRRTAASGQDGADPDAVNAPLSEADIEKLKELHADRRRYLNALASASETKASKLGDVNALQKQLLEEVKSLCVLLDKNLLWLPSTEPIGFDFPAKVFTGFAQTFKPSRLALAAKQFTVGLRQNFVFLLLGALIFGASYYLRGKLEPVMQGMTRQVGRVQADGYRLTPIAIFDGMVRALPWALIPALFGAILTGYQIDDGFIAALIRTSLAVSVMVFIFMTLRAWSRKGGLFELHFRVERDLRHRIIKHTPWFVIVQSVGLILIGMTRNRFDFDSGAAALGVFGFLISSLSMSLYALKLVWGRKDIFTGGQDDDDDGGIYVRNEKWFFLIAIFAPFITAIIDVAGYYDSARFILTRLFYSFCVMIAAYVLHGFFKRSVVIAQRRLALEHARKRRDQAIKARSEREAAEERGEIPVPKIDTEQIDLEMINRQSSQLVNIAVFAFTVIALWALWSGLIPALSVFSEVEVWGYNHTGPDGKLVIGEDGSPLHTSITLWNVMQAFGIGLLTWLAAKNLPGFLEVFVLKRTKMTQGSRFAIVTILGYFIFITGAFIAIDKLGMQWSQLQWVVAALGVGIGFGLQEIIANFISGLIILFERPIRIGDYVTIGENSGTVSRIQIRATTLHDLDHKEILIPNKALVTERVINWTLTNPVTRLKINVGIAYGSDTKQAQELMLKTVKSIPNVLSTPEPNVLFLGFGDSSLDFEVRVFLRDFSHRFTVSSEIHMAIDAAFRGAKIEIPFPQRDLHIKDPEKIFEAMHKPQSKTKAASRTNQNPRQKNAKNPADKPKKA